MSTRSVVIVKIESSDINKRKKYSPKKVTVQEKKWEDEIWRNEGKQEDEKPIELSKQVLLKDKYIGIYCHWDGYPEGVGAALKKNFNDYEKALNLAVGGFCSVISTENIERYATRNGEEWKYIKPQQADTAEKLIRTVGDWAEYAYIFENNKWKTKKL